MTVVERTEGGYTKVETKNGVIQHRDPKGHPVPQQSFAASKQQEQYDTDITERDDDTGQIRDSETTEIEVGGLTPRQLYRVTIAANREYETNQYPSPGWESWTISFESTTFRKFGSKPDALDAGIEKLDDIADLASEEILPVNDVNAKAEPDAELSVEAKEVEGEFRRWSDAGLTIEFSGGGMDGWSKTYPLDVERERIKWDQ
jgi:hypothetical protein